MDRAGGGSTTVRLPERFFLKQPIMIRVCYGLIPCLLGSVYFFGLRSLALTALVFLFGVATEGAFTLPRGKPISSAIFVSCLIFALSLPPTTPFWIAAFGIVFGIVFGKMVFGGFGHNVFNPAMVGRCFIYIAFPIVMTNRWVEPLEGKYGGFITWFPSVDALTTATPLEVLGKGMDFPLAKLFMGNISGSLGETCAGLILIGGVYILVKRSAPWRLAVSCLVGGISLSFFLRYGGVTSIPDPLTSLLSGSFLFGAFFVVTEPITGPKTETAQWIYGFMIGGLTIILRRYSNFTEGIMFAVLFMNMFVPVMDMALKERRSPRKGHD